MAITAQQLNHIPSYRSSEPSPRTRLQQLIETGAVYVAQNLSHSQFATLQAIAARIFKRHNAKQLAASLDASLVPGLSQSRLSETRPTSSPRAFDYQLGLDELDTLTRTRTGYAFAELPDDLQDAILGLVATGDLTVRKLDLARWLADFHNNTVASL